MNGCDFGKTYKALSHIHIRTVYQPTLGAIATKNNIPLSY